jgi:hypothetical protein
MVVASLKVMLQNLPDRTKRDHKKGTRVGLHSREKEFP